MVVNCVTDRDLMIDPFLVKIEASFRFDGEGDRIFVLGWLFSEKKINFFKSRF